MPSLHLQQGRPSAAAARQQRRRSTPVTARSGGAGNDSRLILPGQDSAGAGGRPAKLVAGQGGGTAPRNLNGGLLDGPPALQQQFRPPPGFMDMAGPEPGEEINMSTEEMLSRLRSLTGHWYELCKLLPALQRAGYDGVAVEEATGLERKVQNVWSSAAPVHASIAASGQLSPEMLAHFDVEGEYLLYELRFLSVRQRAPAAIYIAERNLSPHECQVLARAAKEYERRGGHKEGFSNSPGDVLAYKHFRDAMECRRTAEVEACAKRGLAVADTEGARRKLTSLLGEEQGGPTMELPTAKLTMLRMSRDELGVRPLAVAGELQVASGDQVLAAPKISSEGVFGNFKIPPEGLHNEWVALPNWSILTLAVHPVALTIRNCIDVPQVRAATSAKSEEDVKRMKGQGILVADIAAEDITLQHDKYYLVEDAEGKAQLMTGGEAAAVARVLGIVLCVCRPPTRDTPAATTSELLSV